MANSNRKDGSSKSVQRNVLPIPDQPYAGFVAYDAKDPDSKFPPIEPLRPPKGAPNVLIVLIDDVGFGASSVFGGPCQAPTAERIAKDGLRYTRFHTTALCSPTRAALLSGRNHHTVGMGGITEIATSAPGYSSMRPNSMAPLPEILRLNGYSTAQFGKCHEVPVWEASPVGPFDRWPTGSGFEYFYGFVAGETNQWYPSIHEGTKVVEPPKTPEEGYHFMEDMTDRAIAWVRQQRLLAGDKPFFMYFAPGATHAPHHVPKEWADKYKGKFDQGWDKLREETFARQKQLGVIPQDCELTARPKEIPSWDSQTPEFQRVLAREMEVYAGFFSIRRLSHRPPDRRARTDRGARRYADLLHHRRQRRIRRRHAARHVQRMHPVQRDERPRNGRLPDAAHGQARRPGVVQPLCRRLGSRHGHAVPVDEAGRFALGRHAKRHDRALAEGHQGQGRGTPSVPSRHRRGADDSRGRATAASPTWSIASGRFRCRASACSTASTMPRRRNATKRSTSKCSAIEESITKAGRP